MFLGHKAHNKIVKDKILSLKIHFYKYVKY